MVRVTPTGIETTDGIREFDIIVWATGFDFGTGALARMGIVGRDGLALVDHWADGPRTFLGVQTHGFPNLFFPGGPARRRRQQSALQRRPGRLRHRCARLRPRPRLRRDRGDRRGPRSAGPTWSTAVPRHRCPSARAATTSARNIPGKPKRYLLNSGGRPKLFSIIAEVVANDYDAFTFVRLG